MQYTLHLPYSHSMRIQELERKMIKSGLCSGLTWLMFNVESGGVHSIEGITHRGNFFLKLYIVFFFCLFFFTIKLMSFL